MIDREVFVCEAPYNVYIPLIKSIYNYRNNIKTTLILSDIICDNDQLVKRLNNFKFVNDIIYIRYKNDFKQVKNSLLKKFYLLFYRKKLIDIFDKKYHIYERYGHILKCSKINLFWGYHPLSRYIMIKHNNIKFIEEGNGVYYTNRKYRFIKNIVRKIIGLPDINGTGDNIKEIEVSYPNRLIEELQSKAKVLNLCKLEKGLNNLEKKEILSVYFDDKYHFIEKYFDLENLALLITQPFSEDGDMSENEKIKLYRKILEKLSVKNYNILIKSHPREKTEYQKIFKGKNILILPKDFPLELVNLLGNSIKIGITVSSTALKNLNCVDKKVYLNFSEGV